MRMLTRIAVVAGLTASALLGAVQEANAALGGWTCEKVAYSGNSGLQTSSNPSYRLDYYFRHTFDTAGISSTTGSTVLGAGVSDGCGGHIIDNNSLMYATAAASGGASGGAAGLGLTINASRDNSATGAFPATISYTALTNAAVSNTFISGTLPGANMVQVVVSNSAVGNANRARVVIDEFPNFPAK